MWSAPVPIFEDEDEAALISRFVEMSARYPKYSALDICAHIFKDLREPELRSGQAALQWSKDLEILERIRIAKLNDGVEPKAVDSVEDKLRKLEAIYNDSDTPVKERIAAIQLHAQLKGEYVKAVEKTNKDAPRQFPQIVQGIYAD